MCGWARFPVALPARICGVDRDGSVLVSPAFLALRGGWALLRTPDGIADLAAACELRSLVDSAFAAALHLGRDSVVYRLDALRD